MMHDRRFGPFFVNPVVAGIDSKTGEPYISSMDVIGCMTEPSDFAVAGTCEEQLFGMCETLWKPKMNPDEFDECYGSRCFFRLGSDCTHY